MDTIEPPIAIYHVNTPELLIADARGYLAEAIACLQPDCHDETGALGYARDAGLKLTHGVERVAEILPTEGDPLDEACRQMAAAISAIDRGQLDLAAEQAALAVASIRLAGRARYVAWAIAQGENTSLAAADAWLERRHSHGPVRAIGSAS